MRSASLWASARFAAWLATAVAGSTVAAQEPTVTVLPKQTALALGGAVNITVVVCAFEAGDNMVNLDSLRVKANGVDVTTSFTMEAATFS